MNKKKLFSTLLTQTGHPTSKSLNKKHEESIINTCLKLNLAFNANINISITDTAGIITYVNSNFCKTTKFNQDELIGYSHKKINSNSHEASFIQNMWNIILSGNTWKGEIKNKRKDGSLYWIDSIIHPVKDETGKIVEFISIRNEITKQKELEEQLKKALKEKDILMAELHHRVKNNFAILISILKMKFGDNNKSKVIAQDIETKIYSMLAIHESLYSKEDLSKVSAKEFIQSVCSNIISIYRNIEGVELSFNIDDQICFEMSKAMSLSFTINEIITNSCKYAFPSKTGENIVNIALQRIPSTEKYHLELSDNGKGFDQNNISPDAFGSVLIKTLVEDQLKGSYELNSTNGTSYQITF